MRQVVFRASGTGGYTAEALGLSGCVVTGKNLSEAMRNIKQAIYAHLDHLQALGQPSPESTFIDIPKAEGVFTQKLLLRDDVIAEAQKMFPNDDQQMIIDVLNDYGKQPFELDYERTMVAAIRLSEGNVDKLKQLVADARRDYRDVLSWYAIKFGKYPESD